MLYRYVSVRGGTDTREVISKVISFFFTVVSITIIVILPSKCKGCHRFAKLLHENIWGLYKNSIKLKISQVQ